MSWLRGGARVRIVSMDGCMAHIRGKISEGMVTAINPKLVYGANRPELYATVKFNNGEPGRDYPAAPHLWCRGDDGMPEYHV